MSKLSFTTTASDEGQRLDRFLSEQISNISRSQIQKLIEAQEMHSNHILKTGEIVSLEIPDPNQRLQPSKEPLDILYEDEGILVINKPINLVVHPNHFDETDSVTQRVLNYYPAVSAALYDAESSVSQLRPGIVHRLDKDTSGVLIIAKTQESLLNLASQFQAHTVEKIYATLLVGNLKETKRVEASLIRKSGHSNKMGISTEKGVGREAITTFHPERHFQISDQLHVTEVSCDIETGRTHQIRAHAKSLGMPVLGDLRYANRPSTVLAKRFDVHRQMLHAKQLQFTNPKTNLQQTINCPLAPDIENVITALTNASSTC